MHAERHSLRWWFLVVIHNVVIHPLMPVGEVLDLLPSRKARALAARLFAAHDRSFPEGAG